MLLKTSRQCYDILPHQAEQLMSVDKIKLKTKVTTLINILQIETHEKSLHSALCNAHQYPNSVYKYG